MIFKDCVFFVMTRAFPANYNPSGYGLHGLKTKEDIEADVREKFDSDWNNAHNRVLEALKKDGIDPKEIDF